MTIAKDKITEIFCMADDFCHVYDRFIKINGLAPKRDKLSKCPACSIPPCGTEQGLTLAF